MTLPHKLDPDGRQLVRDIVAGLEGRAEKQRQSARVRSIVLRMDESYRAADNAKQAELGRERYHGDLATARQKGADKWRRRAARLAQARAGASADC
jgi:hypothetical protein